MAFKHKKVPKLSIISFVEIYGWGNFFSFISMFALLRYGLIPLKISLLLADMGIDFSIFCSYLVDRFVKYFRLKSIITTNFS